MVIGLDAADPDLVRRWIQAGQLPHLEALAARGKFGRLSSPAWMSTGPVWPSFFAGTSPARHGRFFFRQLENGTYRIVKKRADEIEATPFWEQIEKTGKRVAVLDVPKTYPRRDCHVIQLVGWGVHSAAWETASHPQHLLAEVHQLFGSHPVQNCDDVNMTAAKHYESFVADLISGISQKCELALWLYKREEWDLFVNVFSEAHCAGHMLWHVHDTGHPEHDNVLRQRLGDPLLRIYQQLDDAIGKLMAAAKNTNLIVFSPHGMGANYGGSHLLPAVLERLGMGSSPELGAGRLLRHKSRTVRRIRALPDRVPIGLQKILRSFVPRRLWDTATTRLLSLGNKWAESLAFCVPGDYAGAIRVNLKGREPAGRVNPGDDYDQLCMELATELCSLINPATGQQAVREVTRIDQVYTGELINQLPDLIVQWSGDAPISALNSPRIGEVAGSEISQRSGEDRSDGFLFVAGPDISQGGSLQEVVGDLTDLAPTITALMGTSLTQAHDGRVLSSIFASRR